MNNLDIERKLKNAVENVTPDVRSNIIDACKKQDNKSSMLVYRQRTRQRERIFKLVAAVAVILMVINFATSFALNRANNRVEAVIDIDVNPSIEMKINGKDRVIEVTALNDDALAVLDGMELEGTQTKVAVNAILGSMLANGYLVDEATGSILVSVESNDAAKAGQIQTSLLADINSLLGAYSCDAVVIGQTVSTEQAIDAIADRYNISQGKAELVRKIMDINPSYGEQNLANMTITELSALLVFIQSDEYTDGQSQVHVSDIEIVDNSQRVNATANHTAEENLANTQSAENVLDTSSAEESVSVNVVSGNETVSGDNVVSSNSISANEIEESELEGTVSENSVSENVIEENIIIEDEAVSENEISEESTEEKTEE